MPVKDSGGFLNSACEVGVKILVKGTVVGDGGSMPQRRGVDSAENLQDGPQRAMHQGLFQ